MTSSIVKLGNVATYYNGYAFKPSDRSPEGRRIVRIQDLTGSSYETNYFSGQLPDKFAIQQGDVLISWSASLGVYVWNDEPAWLNQHIFKVGFNKLQVNKSFFVHQIDYLLKASSDLAHGATMRHLTKNTFDSLPFRYPDQTEQLHIANVLDKVDLLLHSCSNVLEKLDSLIKSRFIEMFGDYNLAPQKREWASISSVGIVVGGATPKTKVDAYWGGNAVWITPAELKDGNVFVDDSARKLTPEGIKSASLTLMPRNTVILSSRAPIGKVAIANCDLYCNQGFKNIICGDTLAPRYLYELLRFNSDFLNSLGKGATFKEISKKTVEEVRIPIPPISSQQEYEIFVSQVDKLRFDVQQQIERLETLKKSLMQEYFG
ncbi:restriction endonuclease subunit S [Enorma phocaeensis]|uniref:restriction endonuclease subunit S n=1 Tax=Enorma phocaeensis TaxID=1871019 RepID=UPI000C84F38A|nr:restriction endonuclease subunit S [Enorma phocaeensis]